MKLIFSLLLLCIAGTAFGQKITLKVTGAKDTTVFLTRYNGSKLFYSDTAEMKNGVVTFQMKEKKPGIFALFLPGQKYFEFIVNKEEINMETSIDDLSGKLKVKKSAENAVFIPYVQFLQTQRNRMRPLQDEIAKLDKESPRYAEVKKEMETISKEVEDYQLDLIKNNPDKLMSKVVKMSMEVKIPDAPKDDKGEIIDPMYQLKYYRAHFWDNTDLTDDRIVNTPVFGQKVEQFFGKTMIIQDPDSILNVALPFIDGLKKGSEVFRFVVDYLTNHAGKSNQMGMDKVYLTMVKRYYCARDEKGKSYAFWMPEEKIVSACEDVDLKLKLVKGVVPPNVILQDTNDVWRGFMKIDAEYTVLFFWDPDCGHCIKAAPKLQKLYAEKMKARGVEVFAVAKATGDDYEKWKAFIKKNQLSFINVGLTQKTYAAALENAALFVPRLTTIESLNYATTYDLFATPRVILLDKDKKIVAKQLSIHQLEDILDHLQGKTDSPKLFPPDPEDEAH